MTEERAREEWSPNDAFRAEASRFAEYRLTDRYREDEIEYKAGLGALLRRLTAPNVVEAHGASDLEALMSGHPDLDAVDLTPEERGLLEKWHPYQSLLNLLGGT